MTPLAGSVHVHVCTPWPYGLVRKAAVQPGGYVCAGISSPNGFSSEHGKSGGLSCRGCARCISLVVSRGSPVSAGGCDVGAEDEELPDTVYHLQRNR